MNRDLTQFERMVCPQGLELTWRGKWVHSGWLTAECPAQEAAFPRTYYGEVMLPH